MFRGCAAPSETPATFWLRLEFGKPWMHGSRPCVPNFLVFLYFRTSFTQTAIDTSRSFPTKGRETFEATTPGANIFRKREHFKSKRGQHSPCRCTSLIRNRRSLGPYSRTMPRALWWPWGGGRFLLSKIQEYLAHKKTPTPLGSP